MILLNNFNNGHPQYKTEVILVDTNNQAFIGHRVKTDERGDTYYILTSQGGERILSNKLIGWLEIPKSIVKIHPEQE